MITLNQDQQKAICLFVKETFDDYKTRTELYRDTMEEIYRTVKKFKRTMVAKGKDPKYGEKVHAWETDFLVNKCHEIENKVLPKIIGNTPKWIVSAKPTYKWFQSMIEQQPEQAPDTIQPATPEEMSEMVRDYLTHIYNKQDMQEVLELLARNGIRYWQGFVKADYKYAIWRNKSKKQTIETDEYGQPIEVINQSVSEKIEEEYPCVESKSWVDMYFDPRYMRLEDMPAIIEISRNVRLSFFTQNQSDYMNVDKLVECVRKPNEDMNTYKQRIFALTWIDIQENNAINPSTLDIKQFYGYYSLGEKEDMTDEKLYEFWTVNDTIVVKAEEITAIPYEDFQVFKDTEEYFATGFLEPIISIQNEMNFQKNSSAAYINKIINPPVIRSPNSKTDPRQLNPWPWGIIMTSVSAEQALANIVQYPFRDIPSWYYQQQNDRERQIQSLTFTIDTSNPDNQQALTNTATWAKIKDFENNGVTSLIRKKFEGTMVKIAYKLLQYTADHLENNITIKALDKDWYREVNKELFKEALAKFDIRIEAGSSSYDSLDARREDALAKWNISLTARQAGVPVDLKKRFEDVMETFEWVDKSRLFEATMPWMVGLWAPQQNPQQPQAPTMMPSA